jgi:ribosomal protein L11 methyltransferase
MPWLALRVAVPAASAEALGEALLEAGAQSVSIDAPDHSRPTLTALVASGDALGRCRALLPEPCAVEELRDEDWVRRTQAQFEALSIGTRLWVGASWHRAPQGVEAIVRIDPGLAFGTGSHPSTRLVLTFLESAVKGGERVLDYGCGSGILAIAAAKLGARHVDAVDLDAGALEVTRANALANGVEVNARPPEALAPGRYDVVVANILAQPLLLLAPALAARAGPRGSIALSGILEEQGAELIAAYAPWFDAQAAAREEGWVLIAGSRK